MGNFYSAEIPVHPLTLHCPVVLHDIIMVSFLLRFCSKASMQTTYTIIYCITVHTAI